MFMGYEPPTIKKLDDNLVKQIEFHIAGLPMTSMEYGLNEQYLKDKERRDKQVFDDQ